MEISKNTNVVENLNEEEFYRKYYKPQIPVLIKGFSKHYPAGKKWTLDFMKKTCGDIDVDIFDNNAADHTSSAFTTPDLKMKFSDYVDIISQDKPSPLRIFLFNMFKRKQELRKDFPCPDFFKGILGRMGYMFFGSKDTKVRIHQDIDMSSVLLTQFYGRKKVILISPKYSDLLYRLPFNTYSLIDLDNPDYQKYPGLQYVEATEYIMEPGDALFMPSGWWHYITYLDGGFAVSYRKMAPTLKTKLSGLLALSVYMPLDKMMNFILGKKWLRKKEEMAQERANEAIAEKLFELNYLNFNERVKASPYFHSSLRPHHNH